MKTYILVSDLEVYQMARELSRIGWEIYTKLDWETKKIIGFQFIESVDSVGANLTEGYSRYHYLDKIKFFYNSRGSLSECNDHWLELLKERKKILEVQYKKFKLIANELSFKLNNFIKSTYKARSLISQFPCLRRQVSFLVSQFLIFFQFLQHPDHLLLYSLQLKSGFDGVDYIDVEACS